MAARKGSQRAITCVVADDDPLVLGAISELLLSHGFEVVAQATDGPSALAAIEEHRPTVAILDLAPRLGGIEVAEIARRRNPATTTILYTTSGESEVRAEAVDVGVSGFIRKGRALNGIVDAVERAAAGSVYVDPVLAPIVLRSTVERTAVTLSERERDVLHLLADGKTNDEIGQALHISADTVRTYLRRAMIKLEADNRTQAVATALRESLIT